MYKYFNFERARNCLSFLVKNYKIKEMHIPYYLCDVIRHTLVSEGCKPIFYHIADDFLPALKFSTEDFILYPNYFGICNDNIKYLTKIYPKLIVDNAHAFYDKPSGFACFNSGKKFFNNEKAWLWIENCHFREGITYSIDSDLPYLNTKNIDNMKRQFIKLHSEFSYQNILNIDTKNIIAPFCYPFLAESIQKADEVVNRLSNKGYIIYRYWNNLPKTYNEYKFYSRLVPIPLNF